MLLCRLRPAAIGLVAAHHCLAEVVPAAEEMMLRSHSESSASFTMSSSVIVVFAVASVFHARLERGVVHDEKGRQLACELCLHGLQSPLVPGM